MNLITDPWIPVLFENGAAELVGLEQLYREAETIRDLNVNPPQRIALMRLLLCITQAALDGPENEEEWKTCRERIIPESLDYLSTRKEKFDLYGKTPFLQIRALVSAEPKFLDKLLETSRGENPMFLTEMAAEGHRIADAQKALALLVFQNYSAGGKVGQSEWCGKKHSESTFATPCFTNLFLFLRGKNLIETLTMNLIPKNQLSIPMGTPIWDQMPQSSTDDATFENAYCTFLGRLVPLARLIKLSEDKQSSQCIIGPVPKKYVFSNDPATFRESFLTLKLSKKNGHYYMKVNPAQHLWRELGSLLALSENTEGFSAKNLNSLKNTNGNIVDIWCGGLARGAQAAKIQDMAEWNFSIPVSMLDERELEKYANGVELANKAEWTLKNAIQMHKESYSKELKTDGASYVQKATAHYWSTLDSSYQMLVEIASDDDRNLDDWRALLRKTMHEAFEQACPHETPRQIKAFVQAKRLLEIKEKKRDE
jgi:CRISPR system Cascade subunit CasA